MRNDEGLSAEADGFLEQLSPGGLGWEFLRRRDDYRADFAQHASGAAGGADPACWGLSFFADPDLSGAEQPVFWRPDVDEQAIVIVPATEGLAVAGQRFLPETWPGELHRREGADGLHLLLRYERQEHRIWAPGPPEPGAPFAVLLPTDRTAAVRADAALRFLRCISAEPLPRPVEPSEGRLRRIRMSLRALDARRAGASYRAIAESVFGPDRVDPATWRMSSLRDTTIRLVRSGQALVDGDYRRLVGRRTPD